MHHRNERLWCEGHGVCGLTHGAILWTFGGTGALARANADQ